MKSFKVKAYLLNAFSIVVLTAAAISSSMASAQGSSLPEDGIAEEIMCSKIGSSYWVRCCIVSGEHAGQCWID